MAIYDSQTQLLECLRDIWPEQKGLAALLFQDDLFRRIRRLEIKTEGGDVDDAIGFLPEGFPEWTGATDEYIRLWEALEKEAELDATGPLDAFEDAVCGWVEDMIPENCAFFEAALDSGSLDEKWLHAAQMLLALEQKVPEPATAAATATAAAAATAAATVAATATATEHEEKVTEQVASVTIEPIATLVLSPEPRPRLPTRRLRRAGRPLTPSLRRKARHTRRNKVIIK